MKVTEKELRRIIREALNEKKLKFPDEDADFSFLGGGANAHRTKEFNAGQTEVIQIIDKSAGRAFQLINGPLYFHMASATAAQGSLLNPRHLRRFAKLLEKIKSGRYADQRKPNEQGKFDRLVLNIFDDSGGDPSFRDDDISDNEHAMAIKKG